MITLVLSGCSTLPTSGPVTPFERDIPGSESLILKGYGPVEGSSPDTIVRDFLRASAAGWSDEFQVARSYLTDTAKAAWRPEAQVQIYSDDQTLIVEGAATEVTVEVGVDGIVTPDGKYEVQQTPTKVNSEYRLLRSPGGEWRIDELPDGVLISHSSFRAVYTLASVYFLSPDMRALVPDPRWYPTRRLESYLMQALLEGPSEEIAPAVVSAVPVSARLPLQKVQVTSGRAEVDLEGEYLVNPDLQAALKWQVTSTLMQVPGVTEVQVLNNRQDLDDVAIPSGPTWAMDKKVGVKDGALVLNDGIEPIEVVPASQLAEISNPTVGPVDSSPLAYVSGKQLWGVYAGEAPAVIYEGEGISKPSVDRLGWTWTVVNNEVVVARLAHGEPLRIQTPWESGAPLVRVAISPDGARALLSRGDTDGSVWIAAVKRSADGAPTGLDIPKRVQLGPGRVIDMSWAGNTSALILQDGASGRVVTISTVGSTSETLTAPADAVRISGGATPQAILLDTGQGRIYTRAGVSWRSAKSNMEAEAFPH